MHTIRLIRQLKGRILDVGGGGEGIIGRLYLDQVTAIDRLQGELDEAPSGFEKLVMDAADMGFKDGSFDHVTAFYSFMYMDSASHLDIAREIHRVLVPGGLLHLWDGVYPVGGVRACDLTVHLPQESITVRYEVRGFEDAQELATFARLFQQVGFVLVEDHSSLQHLHQVWRKR